MSRTTREVALLLRAVYRIPEELYYRHPRGSAWAPAFTTRVLSEGYLRRAGLLLIHNHGPYPGPDLSGVDRDSLRALLPACQSTVPSEPHGSVVLGENRSVGGRVWLPSTPTEKLSKVTRAVWQGSPRVVRPSPVGRPTTHGGRLDRLQRVIGENGLTALAEAKIGVVGLCGGGSHVAQQLAHLAFGNLVLVDDEPVELSNLTRMVCTRTADVGRLKTDVIADAVTGILPTIRVTKVPETFPSKNGIAALKECDAVVSCVDGYATRSELMTFGWRHLIPVLDVGMAAIPSEARPVGVDSVFGHCCFYHPGGPCMWCADQLSKEKLAAEKAQETREGYVRGMDAPQVVSFNGLLASWASIELMQYITGFLPESVSPTTNGFLLYDGVKRSLEALAPSRKLDCELCMFQLGAGDPES